MVKKLVCFLPHSVYSFSRTTHGEASTASYQDPHLREKVGLQKWW